MHDTHSFHTPEEFTGKYEKFSKNPVARWLVDNFYRSIAKMVPTEVETVLEVGCGAGYSAERLIPLFPAATFRASDIEPELVAMTRIRNPGIEVRVDSIYELDEEDDSVDLIIALETLEHLEEPERALRELHRVTKRHALLSVPREPLWRGLNMARGAYFKDLGNTPGHLNHWSTGSFTKFVKMHFEMRARRTPLPWTIILAEKKHGVTEA